LLLAKLYALQRIRQGAHRRIDWYSPKRIALKRIHATRFRSLFLCVSFSQNRRTFLHDMHWSNSRKSVIGFPSGIV